jgi:hypothetical protein
MISRRCRSLCRISFTIYLGGGIGVSGGLIRVLRGGIGGNWRSVVRARHLDCTLCVWRVLEFAGSGQQDGTGGLNTCGVWLKSAMQGQGQSIVRGCRNVSHFVCCKNAVNLRRLCNLPKQSTPRS